VTNTPNTIHLSPAEEGELRKAAKLLAEAIVESIETGEQVTADKSDSCGALPETSLGGSQTPKRPSDKPRTHASARQTESPAEPECEPSQRSPCQAAEDGSRSASTQNQLEFDI